MAFGLVIFPFRKWYSHLKEKKKETSKSQGSFWPLPEFLPILSSNFKQVWSQQARPLSDKGHLPPSLATYAHPDPMVGWGLTPTATSGLHKPAVTYVSSHLRPLSELGFLLLWQNPMTKKVSWGGKGVLTYGSWTQSIIGKSQGRSWDRSWCRGHPGCYLAADWLAQHDLLSLLS